MAYRVEIGEIVENATGLNITGASVTVRFHGGAQAPVYDAENGGAQLTQPLTTVNGKIGADYPSGAWVAEGDYDLDVVFGGDTLTFFWPARRATQFVTTLPAGAGTSAPEDGELAIELYDGTNGGAWMRRYRAATSAWDMVGGPPPAGGSLPGSPRVRQEFYLTGATPPVQHLRYNGASWDYVGTPPTVPVTGSPLSILDVGQSGQKRAGRQHTLADFTTLLGVAAPVALYNLGDTSDISGNARTLTNKGTVTFTTGIEGVSNAAAQFTGSTAQALYIADTGANDPFRVKTFSIGCWVKVAKRATTQRIVTKIPSTGAAADSWFEVGITSNNVAFVTSPLQATPFTCSGQTDVCDDRWHHIVATFDDTVIKIYVDGVLENWGFATSNLALTTNVAPLNIGGYGADGATAATSPFFGRVDEVFITEQVFTEAQIRLLYAAKIPHGYSTTPTRAYLSVRRKLRGANWVNADFPSQPLRRYDGGSLTDGGSNAQNLTAINTPLLLNGVDGALVTSYNFNGTNQALRANDAGLPSGAGQSFTIVGWFKSNASGAGPFSIVTWGAAATDYLVYLSSGTLRWYNSGDIVVGPYLADGLWHFFAAVRDNASTDAQPFKLYVDGKLVGASTSAGTNVVLSGANGFRIGERVAGTQQFNGQIASVAVHGTALSVDQQAVLYQKTARVLPTSIKESGAHIEAIDAANIYWIADTLDSQNAVDLAVAA